MNYVDSTLKNFPIQGFPMCPVVNAQPCIQWNMFLHIKSEITPKHSLCCLGTFSRSCFSYTFLSGLLVSLFINFR